MKRADLVRHLLQQGCRLLRDGGAHSVFVNPVSNRTSTVPRHREINDYLCRKICRDLEVSDPRWTMHESEAGFLANCGAGRMSTAPGTPYSPTPHVFQPPFESS